MASVSRQFRLSSDTNDEKTVSTPRLHGWRLEAVRVVNSNEASKKFAAANAKVSVTKADSGVTDTYFELANASASPWEFDDGKHYLAAKEYKWSGSALEDSGGRADIIVNGVLNLSLTTAEANKEVFVNVYLTDDRPARCGRGIPHDFRAT